ncbi:MAG: aminotransferase class I/II-fold pyridoxal phosphate-dependent enzyme [Leptospirales bacterium]
MPNLDHYRTPLFDAMVALAESRKVSFHTPGHKSGKGISTRFRKFVGPKVFSIDLTCLDEVDSLQKPRGVIREAQELAADIYNADQSFFLVNGTSGGNQAMILSCLNPGEPVIMTRILHKSVVSGMIMSDCQPIFVPLQQNETTALLLNDQTESIISTMDRHPEAKTLFLTSPNYYGVTLNLKKIVDAAHQREVIVLLDEAHGPHLHFHDSLPMSGMAAGVDLCVQSTHKIIGGMTQASILHARTNRINLARLTSTLRYIQTTSPSYILMASLDLARMQMATEGKKLLGKALDLARRGRERIRKIPGLTCVDRTEVQGLSKGDNDLDETKLTIGVNALGLTGYQVSQKLNLEYDIQVEMADLMHVLVIVSIGDHKDDIDRLVSALEKISSQAQGRSMNGLSKSFLSPYLINSVKMSPRNAFFADHKIIPLEDAEGCTAADIVTVYPPGIPLLIPGEVITKEVLEYLFLMKETGATLDGLDPSNTQIKIVHTNQN